MLYRRMIFESILDKYDKQKKEEEYFGKFEVKNS
jgi:hypothetical protein